jgi:hypothetical protein
LVRGNIARFGANEARRASPQKVVLPGRCRS